MIEAEVEVATDEQSPLPNGWRWVRLGDVCELNPRRPALARAEDIPTTFIPMSAVEEGGSGVIRAEIRPYGDVKSGYTYVGEGDVLFAKITPCMQNGKHAIARNLTDGIGFGSTEFHVIRPKEVVLSEWVHLFLVQPSILSAATGHFTGAVGQQRVPAGFLVDLAIPLPPLPEQQRIAVILREQMAAVERARAAAEAQLEAARALPAAYLRTVFESDEAQEWPRVQLQDVVQLLPSKSIATNGDTQVLAVTTACLTERGFEPTGVKSARMWRRNASESTLIAGEVLVARSNTPDLVGRAAMYAGFPSSVVASDLTIRLLGYSQSAVSSPFLSAFLSWLYLTGYWKEHSGGASSSMKKITRMQIMHLKIPLPSSEAQQCIATMLRDQLARADHVRRTLEAQLDEIKRLPAALLRQAFSGEL